MQPKTQLDSMVEIKTQTQNSAFKKIVSLRTKAKMAVRLRLKGNIMLLFN